MGLYNKSKFMLNKAPEEIYNDYNFSKIIVRDLFTDDINTSFSYVIIYSILAIATIFYGTKFYSKTKTISD